MLLICRNSTCDSARLRATCWPFPGGFTGLSLPGTPWVPQREEAEAQGWKGPMFHEETEVLEGKLVYQSQTMKAFSWEF